MKLIVPFILFTFASISIAQNPHKLIEKCNADKFQKYLDKGGDVNLKMEDHDKLTGEVFEINLLNHAVAWECEDIIKIILDRKEDIQDFDLLITEAFIYSLSVGNDTISNLLFEQKPIDKGICDICHGNNALMVAASYGRDDWYFKLKTQSDPQYINHSGANLITCAALGSSQKILLDVLSIRGIDINKKDAEGLTPLDYAASNDENPEAFNTLIENGADTKQAWNLLYWWCMYDFDLTEEMIQDRKEDVWMVDEEGDNCIMLLSYFYVDLEESSPGVFEKKLRTIINLMLKGNQKQSNLEFVEQLYQNSITMNILNAMLYIEDFKSEEPVYPKYLEFIAMLCEKAEFCPVYKKEYKSACKIYGEDTVNKWYTDLDLPME